MASDKPTFIEWLRGKRTRDIELPSEGEIDPNLRDLHPDVMGQMEKAARGFKDLQKNAIMQGLYEAAGKKR